MPRVFQGLFPLYWVGMAVVELPLRVNVQPTGGLIVLIALNVASFPPPLVSGILVLQRNVKGCVVSLVGFGKRLQGEATGVSSSWDCHLCSSGLCPRAFVMLFSLG